MELEVKGIKKSFNNQEILHDISFTVKSGRALGLLGRNGAGKTTTIRILMKVFNADSGELLMDGKPFNPLDYKIGYLPEERGLYPKKTINEQMYYFAELRGLEKAKIKANTEKWLKRLGVDQYAKRKLETLSKGNQQKVQLAQTLVTDPDIIILDEPFSGLDPVNSQVLKDVINDLIQMGKLVIFSSHQMAYVEEFCDDIVILNHGDIVVQGVLTELKAEYGANRLFLRPLGMDLETLKIVLEKNLDTLVSVYETKKNGLVLEMKPEVTRTDVIKALLNEGIEIDHFSSYEPSLTDIFVERAGD